MKIQNNQKTTIIIATIVGLIISSPVTIIPNVNAQTGDFVTTDSSGRQIIHEKGINLPTPPGFRHKDNLHLQSMVSSITGGNNLIDIEYTTKSHITWVSNQCVGSGCAGWDQTYFVNGVGNNNYFYQCGLMHRDGSKDPARWILNMEVFDNNGNLLSNLGSSTSIPSETSTRLKLSIPAYNGGSGVQCEADWSNTGTILGYTSTSTPSTLLVSTDLNAQGAATSTDSEYTTAGTGISIGSISYTSPTFIDSSHISRSLSTVNELIWPGVGFSISKSGVVSLPHTFTAQTYTVSDDSAGDVTTS